ncbi:MAG: glycerol-3-phosphate acyltransferase [Lachnospiraceae bacterium]|nr:glycerol-3-phosphate acyltransferase [Lachnospiraceae bacterium]
MTNIIGIVLILILGYIVGSFNLSYFLSKLKGYDIRQHGSGNAGASNVVIMMGKKAGIIVALVDIFKAYLVCTIAMHIFPDKIYIGALAGTSVILGHIFPFYMNFKGGKGLASLGGTILALDPRMFVVLLAIAIVLAVVINYICVVPMSISIIFALVYGYTRRSLTSLLILMFAAVVINFKHIENLKRIKAGTEAHFSLLWDRKSEAERLGKVYDDGKGYENVEENK